MAKGYNSRESLPPSELIEERLRSILERDGRGNPKQLSVRSLEAAYAKDYGAFTTCGGKKFRRFVEDHFLLNKEDQVICPTSGHKRNKKRNAAQSRGASSGANSNRFSVLQEVDSPPGVRSHTRFSASTDFEIVDTLADLSRAVTVAAEQMQQMKSLEKLVEKLEENPTMAKQIELSAKDTVPFWGEWKNIESDCQGFNGSRVQYILIAGEVPRSESKYVSTLRKIPWRSVIDLDSNSDSEENGLFRTFSREEDRPSLDDLWVPESILEMNSGNLASAINWRRCPWLFANGRTKDSPANHPKATFKEWKARWLSAISHFLKVLVENLDPHKPVVTIILPFEGSSSQFIRVLLTRLDEELSSRYATAVKHIVITSSERDPKDEEQFSELSNSVKFYQLPSSLIAFGLMLSLGCAPPNSKMMPTAVTGAPVPLKNQEFLFLSEYLTLLHSTCENDQFEQSLDAMSTEKREEIVEQHKTAFLSGQPISFLSLVCEHDARRTVLETFRSCIQKHLNQRPVAPSTVIELVHNPGAGGSTIARRTLWDLRKDYPCAIVKQRMTTSTDEDEFISVLCDRIMSLEELCEAAPLILLDGESSLFRRSTLSRQIAERLSSRGGKAAILHCLRGKEVSKFAEEKSPHISIVLRIKLSFEEKERFRDKYGQASQSSKASSTRTKLAPRHSPSRVFHFPLGAFLEEFRENMEEIVSSSVDELGDVETRVLRFVALIQLYGGQSVPASLVYKLFLQDDPRRKLYPNSEFLSCNPSYDEMYESLSQGLRMLLVQSSTLKGKSEECVTYDVQHVVVAESVLKKMLGSDRTYYKRLEQYLENLLDRIKSVGNLEDSFVSIFEDLFLHNKDCDHKMRFAVLIEMLKTKTTTESVGQLLKKVASVFPSARFYTHVARYFIYSQPHDYDEARTLITTGFSSLKRNESKSILHDTLGLLYRVRMSESVKEGRITSLSQLEEMASDAIKEYSRAIAVPPSWPNPLVGKVQVWTDCLDWIVKNKCQEVAELVRFLSTNAPEFFRNCLSDAFHHIELIENMLVTYSTADADSTKEKVVSCKMKLCYVKAKSGARSSSASQFLGLPADDFVKECERLSKNPDVQCKSQTELKRLKVYYFMHRDGERTRLEKLLPREIVYLFRLLKELVEEDREYHFISNLLRVAIHLPKTETLSLDEGIHLSRLWQKFSPNDAFAYFYSYIFYFLKVLEGHVVDYVSKYEETLKKCKELTDRQCYVNAFNSYFYLGNNVNNPGLSSLVHRSSLPSQRPSDEFWRQKSRGKLRELEGRIKVKYVGHKRQRSRIYIELINSGIHVFVGRYQMTYMGELGRDYYVDQLVKFVVSFNMRGPVAHGVVISSQ